MKSDMPRLGGLTYKDNLFTNCKTIIKNIQTNLAAVDEYVDEEMGEVTITEGIGLKRLAYITFIDKSWFVIDYITTLIDYYIDNASGSDEPMVMKDQIQILFRLAPGFSTTASVVGSTPKKFEEHFKVLPEIELEGRDPGLIADQYEVVGKTHMTGFAWSPIFFLGKAIGDYEVKKYKERKDKIQYTGIS